MDNIDVQTITRYRKKRNRADLRKCMFCRRDKQKCEVTVGDHVSSKRKWPGQKCDRCTKYKYACSANYNAKEEPRCRFCRENKEQCFPPHREWPGQRCDRCEHFGDPCGVGLTATEDKHVRQHHRDREDNAVQGEEALEIPGVQNPLAVGDLIDYAEGGITAMSSFGSTTPYATRSTPTAASLMTDDNFEFRYSPFDGILERSSPEGEDIAQLAGTNTWTKPLESGYDAATHAPADPLDVTDFYFTVGSWGDVTHARTDRWSSEDTSALMATVTTQLQSHPAGSPPRSEVTTVTHSSRWSSPDAGACSGPTQWTQWAEYVPSVEHEHFTSPYHVYGVPIFSLKVTPSDPYAIMNAIEHRLDQRMGSLYGNPATYDKVCSRKFGTTLAEWYREDVRQLAHCGYLMVKHALFACMAADSLITYRKLAKKRRHSGRDLTDQELRFHDQVLQAFDTYYRSAFYLLEKSMREYKDPTSSGSLPAKPLLYACYLLGVAVVCTNQPEILLQIYMWFIELESTSGAFPFALVVPQKQKSWGVVLRLPPDSDGTVHELEVGRDLSALCKQRWRFDGWARL